MFERLRIRKYKEIYRYCDNLLEILTLGNFAKIAPTLFNEILYDVLTYLRSVKEFDINLRDYKYLKEYSFTYSKNVLDEINEYMTRLHNIINSY